MPPTEGLFQQQPSANWKINYKYSTEEGVQINLRIPQGISTSKIKALVDIVMDEFRKLSSIDPRLGTMAITYQAFSSSYTWRFFRADSKDKNIEVGGGFTVEWLEKQLLQAGAPEEVKEYLGSTEEKKKTWPTFFRLAKNLTSAVVEFARTGAEYVPVTDENGNKVKDATGNNVKGKTTSWVRENKIDKLDPPLADATGVSSKIKAKYNQPDMHKVVLDLDYDAALIQSSTPRHHHLILEKYLSWDDYKELLTVLAKHGIIQQGYAQASIARGASWIRTPWHNKLHDPGFITTFDSGGGFTNDFLSKQDELSSSIAKIESALKSIENPFLKAVDTIKEEKNEE